MNPDPALATKNFEYFESMSKSIVTVIFVIVGFLMIWPSISPFFRHKGSLMTEAREGSRVIERLKRNREEGKADAVGLVGAKEESEGAVAAAELLSSVVQGSDQRINQGKQRNFAAFDLGAKLISSQHQQQQQQQQIEKSMAATQNRTMISSSNASDSTRKDVRGEEEEEDAFVFVSDVLPFIERVLKSPADSSTLMVVVANILSHPREAKYRMFRLTSTTPGGGEEESKFSRQVWRRPSFRALLESVGFRASGSTVSLLCASPSRLAVLDVVLRKLKTRDSNAKSALSSSASFAGLGPGHSLVSPTSGDAHGASPEASQAEAVLRKKMTVAVNTGILTLKGTPLGGDGSSALTLVMAAMGSDSKTDEITSAERVASEGHGRGAELGGGDCDDSAGGGNAALGLGSVLRVVDFSRCSLEGWLDPRLLPHAVPRTQSSPRTQEQGVREGARGAGDEEEVSSATPAAPPPSLLPPPSVLSVLRRLNLDHNALTRVPAELGLLACLTSLNLNHNRLGLLRSDGSGVPASEKCCCLPALPPKLSQLGLAGNALKEVPSSVESCRELREISLDLNRLTEFPPALLRLPALERASLAANLISALPPAPAPLPKPQPPQSPLDHSSSSSSSSSSSASSAAAAPGPCSHTPVVEWWLPALRHLDLSYNRCSPSSFPAWVFTHTPLQGECSHVCNGKKVWLPEHFRAFFHVLKPFELSFGSILLGLALDGNEPTLTVGTFEQLEGVDEFLQRRAKSKNKGVGGCWLTPGGISSFGFCGLDARGGDEHRFLAHSRGGI